VLKQGDILTNVSYEDIISEKTKLYRTVDRKASLLKTINAVRQFEEVPS